jgi:hypothetical protein
LHRILVAALALLAVFASLQIPVSANIHVVFTLAIFLTAVRQIVWLGKSSKLIHHVDEPTNDKLKGDDSAGKKHPATQWQFQMAGRKPVSGTLIQAGYRSAALVVLVLQSSNGRWHRIPIWVDSVSGSQFSYLHVQLAYNANVPQARSIRPLLPFFSRSHQSRPSAECIVNPCCTTLPAPMNKTTRP